MSNSNGLLELLQLRFFLHSFHSLDISQSSDRSSASKLSKQSFCSISGIRNNTKSIFIPRVSCITSHLVQVTMSQSPATPNKPSDEAGKTALSSTEKPFLGSRVVRSSLHEPSPASTYGETTVGDSIPATPQDVGSHGMSVPATLASSALRMLRLYAS